MNASVTVILATGGTIAGTAADPAAAHDYEAARLGIDSLVAAVPPLATLPLESRQVAQVDSRSMTHALWQRLAGEVHAQLARREVGGVVVTHGTDTLEETAYFLQRVLAPLKPVVLTAAMRPANAPGADGPANLYDAVRLARLAEASGVTVVVGGEVFDGRDLRKVHANRLAAFAAGDGGPLGRLEGAALRRWRDWPRGSALGLERIARDAAAWPRVEIVLNHAGADGRIVDALVAGGVDGIVVAGTGSGTLSDGLAAAAARAVASGVVVRRASRCAFGAVRDSPPPALPAAGAASAVQARVEVLLELLGRPPRAG